MAPPTYVLRYPPLSELSGMLAVRGLVGLTLGALTLAWPGVSLDVFLALFAVYAILDGVLALGTAWRGRRAPRPGGRRPRTLWLVVEGVAGVGAGVLAIAAPGLTAIGLAAYVGLWLVAAGATRLVAAARLRNVVSHAWLLGAGGLFGALIGLDLFLYPATSVPGLVVTLGIYGIVAGAVAVAAALRLHYVERRAPAAMAA